MYWFKTLCAQSDLHRLLAIMLGKRRRLELGYLGVPASRGTVYSGDQNRIGLGDQEEEVDEQVDAEEADGAHEEYGEEEQGQEELAIHKGVRTKGGGG